MFSRLREHGVAVVTGVDSGIGPTKRHGNAWRAVGEMVEGGYPVAEALATATSVAADACGLAGETGRLAEGYAADLLVVDGDLSSDISRSEQPARGAHPRDAGSARPTSWLRKSSSHMVAWCSNTGRAAMTSA